MLARLLTYYDVHFKGFGIANAIRGEHRQHGYCSDDGDYCVSRIDEWQLNM